MKLYCTCPDHGEACQIVLGTRYCWSGVSSVRHPVGEYVAVHGQVAWRAIHRDEDERALGFAVLVDEKQVRVERVEIDEADVALRLTVDDGREALVRIEHLVQAINADPPEEIIRASTIR